MGACNCRGISEMPGAQGTAAERQRRRRQRRRSGRGVLRVEVDFAALADALVEAGWLAAWDAENPEAIAVAVGRLLTRLSRVTG